MILKDYPFKSLYPSGYTGLCIRINDDSKDLNKLEDVGSCIKELNAHPKAKEIAYSNIVSERDFFDVKVLVIDYKEV